MTRKRALPAAVLRAAGIKGAAADHAAAPAFLRRAPVVPVTPASTLADALAIVRSHRRARGRHTPGIMNHTEKRYADHLELQRRAGAVLWFAFEAVTLRLAKRTRYTPDFAVLDDHLVLTFHEVKGGWWEDDARVKIKVAAELFPFFGFVAAVEKRAGQGFELRVVG